MKPTIPCKRRSLCAVYTPPGFLALPRLYCTERQDFVDACDGCTFGERGVPQTAADGVFAIVEDHAAVIGWAE